MATLTNTLYPPVVATFQPAFIYKGEGKQGNEVVRIYYSNSQYNAQQDIKAVQFSVVNQLNNENATVDSSGILFSSGMNYDESREMYYIDIKPSTQISGGQFNINQFYKLQLRFDGSPDYTEDSVNTIQAKNAYLVSHQQYFSEWSSVSLLRPILYPHLRIRIFEDYKATNNKGVQSIVKGVIPIVGKLYFDRDNDRNKVDYDETETMESFQISVYSRTTQKDQTTGEETEKVTSEYTSPTIYTGDNLDPNDINYSIDLQTIPVDPGTNLTLTITATTKDQYTVSQSYQFQISEYSDTVSFTPTITESVNNDDGIVTINVKSNDLILGGTVYIKRLSSLDGFKQPETMYSQILTTDEKHLLNVTLKDYTVASLVWYRYSVQYVSEGGIPGSIFYSNVVMPDFDDAIISRDNRQYAIRYNYQVSNYKPVVNRSRIDTLGGKYPRFAENAILNYKQFSISGTLSAEADVHQFFIEKNDDVYTTDRLKNYYSSYRAHPHRSILDNQLDDAVDTSQIKDLVRNEFQDYYKDSDDYVTSPMTEDDLHRSTSQKYLTTTMNDWMWEREFRERLVEWLNDGEPKLYRSKQEGNMTVMLSDVSLTPTANSGRFTYTFSATMYEVEKSTSMDTLDDLGIFNRTLGEDAIVNGKAPEHYTNIVTVGQLSAFTVTDKNDIRDKIMNDLKMKYGYTGHNEDKDVDIYDQNNVRSNRKPDNLLLRNVKIFFHNKPHLYYFIPSTTGGGNTYAQIIDSANDNLDYNMVQDYALTVDPVLKERFGIEMPIDGDGSKRNAVLGYSLTLKTGDKSKEDTSTIDDTRNIFVNDRGYYQVPNDLDVRWLSFNRIGDVVTVEYTLVYREYNNSAETITGSSTARTVIGQYASSFVPDRYQGEFIRQKYNFVSEDNYRQYMSYWRGISLDVTPFALCDIEYYNVKSSNNEYLVGQSGVLRMLRNFNVKDIKFLGRRMSILPKDRQPYLEEWQCVLDDSVTNSDVGAKAFNWFTVEDNLDTGEPVEVHTDTLDTNKITNGIIPINKAPSSGASVGKVYKRTSEIKHPKFNTVYLINGKMMIYYINGRWYNFEYLGKDDTNMVPNTATDQIGLAKVPIDGQINYYGSVTQVNTL